MLSLFINQNLLASCSCSGNLVSNPSFESGTTGWSKSGGNLYAGTGAVKCGSKSGDFQITNSSNNWVSQTIASGTIPVGSQLQLKVYAGTHNNSYNHYVGFVYFTSSWNYISSTDAHVNKVLSASPTGPQLYTVNSTVPANAHYVQVRAMGSGSWIKTDGWCATVTSMPTCNPNDQTASSGFCAPSSNCSGSNKYNWSQSINQSTGMPSSFRLGNWSGGVLYKDITSGFPAAASGPITVSITDAVSYDGYVGRSNTGNQANERWRIKFYKGSSVVYTSPYTTDGLATGAEQEYWRGALGSSVFLPNGFDKIRLEHYNVANPSASSAGSVVPTSFCVSYSACDNVTNPGVIAGVQSLCGPYNPSTITSTSPASGGSGGSIEYIWIKNSTASTSGHTVIPGATGLTYNPPTIDKTTYYRRCARRSVGCTAYSGESNWIKKEVKFCAPTPICSGSTKFAWSQTINPTTGAPSVVRLINSSKLTHTITSGIPTSAKSGAMTVSITDAVSWDGYASRGNVTQTNEKWRLKLYKGSSVVYTSPYTNDVADNVVQASWRGALGGTASLTNGFDKVVIEHIGGSGAGSVVPSSFCIKYTPCGNITTPGSIATNYTYCNSGNPPAFTSVNNATGGCGGSIQYQWQKRTGTSGTWSNISGATAATYNQGTTTATTQFRRRAKRSTSTSYLYSNVVTVTVNKEITTAGAIGSPQTFCNSGNVANLTNTTSASGGSGGTIQYVWQKSTNNSTWSTISGATSSAYNPGTITTTTYYRRGAKRSVCGTYDYTSSVKMTVNKSLVSGGAVGSNQSFCNSGNPVTFTNTTSASGGTGGTIAYQWQKRTGTSGSYANISGATSATYNAPSVSATTQYRRRAVRTACSGNKYSNVVTVTVQDGVDAGTNGNTTVCDHTTTAINLAGLITGEDAGGTWTRLTGTGGTFNASAGTYSPAVGATTSTFRYTVTGTAPCPNDMSVATVTINVCQIMISGNVFNDTDGLTDNDVDGTGINNPSNTPVYANLVDAAGNVVATATIGSNGSYQFPNVTTNATYTMVLSTTQGTVGQPAPQADLPGDWMNTGESPNNSTSDGTPNGVQTVVVGTSNVPNIDFGIQQPPTPGTNVEASQVNPGGNVSVPVPANGFSGTDPSGGTVTALRIVAFPTNTESITINGMTYTQATWPAAGVTIPTNAAGEPTQPITLNPVDGAVTATIMYKSIDNAGVESPSTGYEKLPFGVITISGNVYEDNNGETNVDGTGISNPSSTQLYANLVDANGNVVDEVAVGPTGAYTFNEVTPNTTYTMVLSTTQGTVGNPAPSADLPFGWDNVSEDCCDNTGNDGNTNGITTVVVATTNVPEVNFGITQPLTIGNRVFIDVNQDGNRDAGELWIPGATVKLYKDNNSDGTPDGAAVQTTTTNTSGVYRFDDLTPGSYIVGVTPPAPANGPAYLSTEGPAESSNPNDDVNWDDNGINTVAGETQSGTITLAGGTEPTNDDTYNAIPDDNSNLSVDFGFYQPIAITGNVYNDENGETNVDGTPINNPSSTPVYANLVDAAGNVVATDPINPNGTYEFDDVKPNTTYTVVLSTTQGTVGNPAPTADLPTGWDNVGEDCCDNTGNDGSTDGTVTVTVGTTDVDEANFGIHEPLAIGNHVWVDENQDGTLQSAEPKLQGATVKLYEDANMDGTPDGAAIDTKTTNASGSYIFTGLDGGSYVIGVTPPTPTTGPAYESTDGPGQEMNPNNDGNNNDNGINTVAGETFSGTVTIAAGTEPTNDNGYSPIPDNNSNLSVDFGFAQPIKIAGNVYHDENGETNVDGTPINNPSNTPVYANLVDAAGNVVGTDPINSNGTYEFTDVEPNTTYTVVLSTTQGTVGNPAPTADLPTGWDNVGEDCCDNTGNDGTPNGVVTVTTATTDVDEANFGIHQPLAIGNHVWVDENQDGTLQGAEPKLQGATVKLYEDANSDGTPDGAAIDTKTTNANGVYIFTGLDAGNYVVGVTPPAPANGPAYESTDGPGQEMNPNNDGNNNDNGINTVGGETFSGTVSIAAGTEPTNDNGYSAIPDNNSNLSVDFGFAQPIKLSGIVFNDESGPANVDGSPIGMAGTTQLYANLIKPDGTVDRITPIDNQGMYEFDDVVVNTSYQVVLTSAPGTVGNNAPAASLPNGWLTVSEDGDGDGIGNDGTPDGINLATTGTTDLPMVNFGIREPVSVGNLVWIDENQNGVKDANELPLQNAIVNIYEDDNNDGTPDGAAIGTMTTGTDGLYEFSDLNSGKFIIGVVPPTIQDGSYVSPTVGEEANPNLDVDDNDNGVNQVGMEVRSGTINLVAGAEPTGEVPNNTNPVPDANSNLTVDFGFYACPTGFNFDPVDVCAASTFDLTAAEPTEFTGGVWTMNNMVVANPTAVDTGTYTYNFNNGSCSATGSLLVTKSVPDYTPTIQIAPSAITGTSQVRVILNISEILNKDACSDLYILVPKLLPRFVFNYLPNATTIGGIPVHNADWQFFENANPNFYIWQYTGTGGLFPGNGSSTIGYIGTYDPNNTDGQSTFSVQIFQGSGGETNQTNNTDSDLLIYFR
jgi:hypothetical protein